MIVDWQQAFVNAGLFERQLGAQRQRVVSKPRWLSQESAASRDVPFGGPWVLPQSTSRTSVLRVSGDCRGFFNARTTNDFRHIVPGETKQAVVTTSRGKMVDLLTVVQLEESEALVLCSACRRSSLTKAFATSIPLHSEVSIDDETKQWQILYLSEGHSLAETPQRGRWIEYSAYSNTKIIDGDCFGGNGYTIVAAVNGDSDDRVECCQSIMSNFNGLRLTQTDAEVVRIVTGTPGPDQEITTEFTPLEAGLWHLVSFNKGDYVGQQTIGRMRNLDGVKRLLLGLVFNEPVSVGTNLYDVEGTDKSCGRVSSAKVFADGSTRCLAYMRRRSTSAVPGARCVTEDGVYGDVVEIRSATRSKSASPKSSKSP